MFCIYVHCTFIALLVAGKQNNYFLKAQASSLFFCCHELFQEKNSWPIRGGGGCEGKDFKDKCHGYFSPGAVYDVKYCTLAGALSIINILLLQGICTLLYISLPTEMATCMEHFSKIA
jgi:hypothetical protein